MQSLSARHSAWIARCFARGELAPLGPLEIEELVALLGERSYPAGAVLFRTGEAPARIHLLRQGSIELSREIRGRRVVLQLLRPGDVFGDVALLVRMTEPYDAVALEDSVVLSFDSLGLFRLLEARPRLAQRWLVSFAMRMAATQGRLVDLLAGGLEAQVASVLSREAEAGVVRLSQSVLAELLGARRTSINRILRALEDRGVVRLGYGQVEVLDAGALLQIATGSSPRSGLAVSRAG